MVCSLNVYEFWKYWEFWSLQNNVGKVGTRTAQLLNLVCLCAYGMLKSIVDFVPTLHSSTVQSIKLSAIYVVIHAYARVAQAVNDACGTLFCMHPHTFMCTNAASLLRAKHSDEVKHCWRRFINAVLEENSNSLCQRKLCMVWEFYGLSNNEAKDINVVSTCNKCFSYGNLAGIDFPHIVMLCMKWNRLLSTIFLNPVLCFCMVFCIHRNNAVSPVKICL